MSRKGAGAGDSAQPSGGSDGKTPTSTNMVKLIQIAKQTPGTAAQAEGGANASAAGSLAP